MAKQIEVSKDRYDALEQLYADVCAAQSASGIAQAARYLNQVFMTAEKIDLIAEIEESN